MEKQSRRSFFKTALFGMATLPLLRASDALAILAKKCPQGAPKSAAIQKKLIDPKAKNAQRLDYVMNYADAKGHKKFTPNSHCGNCKFYREDKKEPEFGKCSMLANRYVPSCGWCKSYKLDKKKA